MTGGPIEIAATDFAGWTDAQAGVAPSRRDPRYQPVLSTIDARGAGTDAAVLVAEEGRGRVIYTGLTLRLQMVAATNPGAARLLVSLLTLTAPR